MEFIAVAYGIIEVEFFVSIGDRRRPESITQVRLRADHGTAGKLPLKEIGGLKNGKNLSHGLAAGLCRAGADGVIDAFMLPNEWIGKIAAINWIQMGLPWRCYYHVRQSRWHPRKTTGESCLSRHRQDGCPNGATGRTAAQQKQEE